MINISAKKHCVSRPLTGKLEVKKASNHFILRVRDYFVKVSYADNSVTELDSVTGMSLWLSEGLPLNPRGKTDKKTYQILKEVWYNISTGRLDVIRYRPRVLGRIQ